jgi:hypothetical protein
MMQACKDKNGSVFRCNRLQHAALICCAFYVCRYLIYLTVITALAIILCQVPSRAQSQLLLAAEKVFLRWRGSMALTCIRLLGCSMCRMRRQATTGQTSTSTPGWRWCTWPLQLRWCATSPSCPGELGNHRQDTLCTASVFLHCQRSTQYAEVQYADLLTSILCLVLSYCFASRRILDADILQYTELAHTVYCTCASVQRRRKVNANMASLIARQRAPSLFFAMRRNESSTNRKLGCPPHRFSSDAALELLGDGFLDSTQTLRQFYDLFTRQLSLPGAGGSMTHPATVVCWPPVSK